MALDPELLGHVFENLLATYNPETGTVARKATGSFYTPRIVVDWMVDQALTVYFRAVLDKGETFTSRNGLEKRLQRLLSWEESDHEFSPKEVEKLIDAIDHMKALDPACGSGAFPMGLLQKLVHVLKKLDPDNRGWRRRQQRTAEAMESSTAREETQKAIERAFAHDNDDYGRKLFLIENCLYGVDIQPIACQIAKLRFFISLIVDQTIDPNESNLDQHARLVIDGGGEDFASLDGDRRIARDDDVHQAPKGFDTQGQRGNVQQQEILESARQNLGLDGRPQGNGFVRILSGIQDRTACFGAGSGQS